MTRIVAIAPDLMFASRIEATLSAEGHEVALFPSVAEAVDLERTGLIVCDLDRETPDAVVGLGIPVLGFYSHTDAETRERAEAAGVDLVVPRSRMAREMPALVERLLAEESPA